jgi:hypothetical protein
LGYVKNALLDVFLRHDSGAAYTAVRLNGMLNVSTTAPMEALAAIESQIARHHEQVKELARRSPVWRQLPA